MRNLISLPKLQIAWTKLNKRNRRSNGVDGVTIAAFAANLDLQLKKIARQLADGSYCFQGSKGVLIDKNDGGKRGLKIATIRDRVVAKALALDLEPKLGKFDQPCSFGYRKNLGTADAVEAIHKLADSGSRWVLEADIKKFFDRVDRQALLSKLKTVVRSQRRLELLEKALHSEIDNKAQIDPDLLAVFPSAALGIPQGNTLSPLLANFYLYSFDKAMLKKGYGLVRYADDFVVMCKSKAEAEEACKFAEKFLKVNLGLELHELSSTGKTQIRRYTDGFNFVGFFIRDRYQMPPGRTKDKYKERVKQILKSDPKETLIRKVQRLNNTSKGWYEAFKDAELEQFPIEADDLVLTELSVFMRERKLLRHGDTISLQQARIIGVRTLGDLVRNSSSTKGKKDARGGGRRPRTRLQTVGSS